MCIRDSRLGVQQVKWQLEDLSFATLHPKRYAEIEQMVAARQPEREAYLAEVMDTLIAKLESFAIKADVRGRPKHLWSIYEKMVVGGKEFDDIFDLVGLRVIVDDDRDCWAVLGAIHALWSPVQGRFKDYINSPKFNLYQSLHTTVIGPRGKSVEVQVRTLEMHRRAEFGIAAHWGYKEGASNKEIAWMQRLVDVEEEEHDPIAFLEALKLDLGQDEVYVFTPKGRVIALVEGATPIDFAYAVHLSLIHILGLFSGAYSSIFIASPLLAIMKEREPRFRDLAARVGQRADRAALSPAAAARMSGEGAQRTVGSTRSATATMVKPRARKQKRR